MRKIGSIYAKSTRFLYRLYQSVLKEESQRYDNIHKVEYGYADHICTLRYGAESCSFSKEELMRCIPDMIGVLEDILPMGSVVELKKEKIKFEGKVPDNGQIRLVITNRFMGGENGAYFPYEGAVYPIGVDGRGKRICFTSALIKKVLFRGYADEMEEAYVYAMKKQLILQQERKTAGFVSWEEAGELKAVMHGEEVVE